MSCLSGSEMKSGTFDTNYDLGQQDENPHDVPPSREVLNDI